MSQNSKTISARVPYQQWLVIMQQAADLKMHISDWLLLQIEKANQKEFPLTSPKKNYARYKKRRGKK